MGRLPLIVGGVAMMAAPVILAGIAHATGHLAAARWLGQPLEIQLGTGWRLATAGRVKLALPLPLIWVSLPAEGELTWSSFLVFRAAGPIANLLGAVVLALVTALVLDPSSGALDGTIDLLGDSGRSLVQPFVGTPTPTSSALVPVPAVEDPQRLDGQLEFLRVVAYLCLSMQLGLAAYNVLPLPFSDALRVLERFFSRRLQEASWILLVALWLWTVIVDVARLSKAL